MTTYKGVLMRRCAPTDRSTRVHTDADLDGTKPYAVQFGSVSWITKILLSFRVFVNYMRNNAVVLPVFSSDQQIPNTWCNSGSDTSPGLLQDRVVTCFLRIIGKKGGGLQTFDDPFLPVLYPRDHASSTFICF